MSYTICNVIDLGPAYTGATLNAQLYNSSNATVGSALTTGFYERSGAKGLFAYVLSIPDGHVGWCDVYVNGASSVILATLPINPAELETKALVVEALAVDTYAQLSGVLSGTPTLAEILRWLAMLSRNKIIQTSSLSTLRNDADSSDVATSTISIVGSTLTRGEWA